MNTTVVWVITAMLWWQGAPNDFGYAEYEAKQFNGRGECLDYIWNNKADLVQELFEVHGYSEKGQALKTWGFYCETTQVYTTDL